MLANFAVLTFAQTAPVWAAAAKKRPNASPIFAEHDDPLAPRMSPDAVQLAEILGISAKLRRVMELNRLAVKSSGNLSRDQKDERSDLKFEILEIVEETRLQIDFVLAEIDEEQVILEEATHIFSTERDNRVNRANQLAFRTNGVLWAVAEALDIPTYKYGRLSIPSGSIGILAGIVPSLFSGYATRSSSGGHYRRQIYPNIMTKICDIEPIARVEYPDVVWQFFLAKPDGDSRSRKQVIFDHWVNDGSMHIFKDGVSRQKLLWVTGNEPYTADLDLVSDKLLMMGQIKAVVLQMSRPLLEICMALRGKKHFEENDTPESLIVAPRN